MGNRGRQGRNDWHRRAAEYHDLAAHAHRVAATHQGQGDFRKGQKFSKQAMDYATKALRFSQEAHQNPPAPAAEEAKTPTAGPAKQSSAANNGSKTKG